MLEEHPDIDARTPGDREIDSLVIDSTQIDLLFMPGTISPTELRTNDGPIIALVDEPPGDWDEPLANPVAILSIEVTGEALRAAVLAVASGLSVIDPDLARDGQLRMGVPSRPVSTDSVILTPRERQVLELVSEGMPNKAIAHNLGISEHTVKFHLGSLMGKLGAESRTEAVMLATRQGILTI